MSIPARVNKPGAKRKYLFIITVKVPGEKELLCACLHTNERDIRGGYIGKHVHCMEYSAMYRCSVLGWVFRITDADWPNKDGVIRSCHYLRSYKIESTEERRARRKRPLPALVFELDTITGERVIYGAAKVVVSRTGDMVISLRDDA